MVEIDTGQVPGCILKKRRPTPTDKASKENDVFCRNKCDRCGWNVEEAAARIAQIRAGKLSQYGQLQFLSVRK